MFGATSFLFYFLFNRIHFHFSYIGCIENDQTMKFTEKGCDKYTWIFCWLAEQEKSVCRHFLYSAISVRKFFATWESERTISTLKHCRKNVSDKNGGSEWTLLVSIRIKAFNFFLFIFRVFCLLWCFCFA